MIEEIDVLFADLDERNQLRAILRARTRVSVPCGCEVVFGELPAELGEGMVAQTCGDPDHIPVMENVVSTLGAEGPSPVRALMLLNEALKR